MPTAMLTLGLAVLVRVAWNPLCVGAENGVQESGMETAAGLGEESLVIHPAIFVI